MVNKPKVGMKVRLNDRGMRQIGGLKSKDMIKQSECMKVMWVSSKSITYPENTYIIEVDQPLIKYFLIDNFDIEEIK